MHTPAFNAFVLDCDVKELLFPRSLNFCVWVCRGLGRGNSGDVLSDGADRDRTDGLRLAKAALSQLSYSPRYTYSLRSATLVGLGRLELPTSPLSGVRSNHLSYRPLRRSRPLSKLNSELASARDARPLRKEVIQPQVPLRLPCYDFTPVTGRTLGSCLPHGLAH